VSPLTIINGNSIESHLYKGKDQKSARIVPRGTEEESRTEESPKPEPKPEPSKPEDKPEDKPAGPSV
jgi:hypothetical protein